MVKQPMIEYQRNLSVGTGDRDLVQVAGLQNLRNNGWAIDSSPDVNVMFSFNHI